MQLKLIVSFTLWFVFIFWPFQNITNYMKIKKYMFDICKQ